MVTELWQGVNLRVYRPLFDTKAAGCPEETKKAMIRRNDQRAPDGRGPTCWSGKEMTMPFDSASGADPPRNPPSPICAQSVFAAGVTHGDRPGARARPAPGRGRTGPNWARTLEPAGWNVEV